MKNQSFVPPNLEKQDDEEDEGDDEEDIHMNERAICKVCQKESN